jgi:hypothetical protein
MSMYRIGATINDIKNLEIHGFLKEGNFDVFGMTETNIHWHNSKTQVKDIMYGWFSHLHIAQKYYKDYPTTANYQVGGVAQATIGDLTCRVDYTKVSAAVGNQTCEWVLFGWENGPPYRPTNLQAVSKM